MIPTKIKAVREDPKNPLLDCYANDPTTIAKLAAMANQKSTSTETNMTIINQGGADNDFISSSQSTGKLPAFGIGAVRGDAMVRALTRLKLIEISAETSEEVQKLAASGTKLSAMITKPFSIRQVDQALARTDATVDQKFAFKTALAREGLMERHH